MTKLSGPSRRRFDRGTALQQLQALARAPLAFWQGPPDLPRGLQLEWRFVAMRWLAMLFVALGLPLAQLPAERLVAAYAVLILAAAYNVATQRLLPRYPTLFARGYVTVVCDGVLNVAMISIGGGFDTPFYFILFTITMTTAMRYGYGPSLAMALLYVGFDALQQRPGGLLSAPFVFRSGFLCITTLLASYLGEQARRAEAALEERLRQANRLNEATAMLGASLQFESVLYAVTTAASHLLGSSCAVLLCSLKQNDDPACSPAFVSYPAADDLPLHHDLAALCRRYSGLAGQLERLPEGQDRVFDIAELPSPEGQVVVLIVRLPAHQDPPATLVLAAPIHQPIAMFDVDILNSFVERITLAIDNALLYHTLDNRSQDLQRAYAELATTHQELQELINLDEMKTNLLSNVSHELRTPLSSIRAFSELLLAYDDDPAVQKEFLGIINAESERLTRLVNDVLDISKIESGHMDWHLTTLDLTDVLHETARSYAMLMAKNGLSFEQEIPDELPPISADRDRIQQVVGNLLHNAVKFTQRGTIKLSAEQVGNAIHVSVVDSGIGIAPEDQERIFEKFQQVGQMLTDKPAGTGLGLSICKDIIEHHAGRIWVDSEPGRGSTFTFSLPVAAEQGRQREPEPGAPTASVAPA